MDAHFRLLGLSRGCDEETVRKAYRQRALEYHPDRNPNGGEMFKRVQASYEAITQHMKAHGGRDVVLPERSGVSSSSSGSAYAYARRQQQKQTSRAAPFDDTPLFTEEELFGGDGVPGGFASEARRAGSSGPNPAGAGGAGRRTSASYAHSAAHHEADAHRQRAHGARVPVSGYDGRPPHPGMPTGARHPGPSPRTRPTSDESTHFQDMYKAYVAKGYGSRSGPGTSSSSSSANRYDPEDDADEAAQEKLRAMWRDLDHVQSPADKQAALKASWDALQRDIGRKLQHQQERERQQQQQRNQAQKQSDVAGGPSTADSEATYEAVEKEMAAQAEAARREWQAKRDLFLRQEEEAREASRKHAAEEVLRRHEAHQQRQAEIDAAQAQRAAASEMHLDEINDGRRELMTQLLYQKYTPDPADVGDMTDMQVYVLSQLLRRAQARVEKVLEARLARGPCSRCQRHPKASHVSIFHCQHACVCQLCATTALRCPLCGSGRVEGRTSLPTSPGAQTAEPVRHGAAAAAAAGPSPSSSQKLSPPRTPCAPPPPQRHRRSSETVSATPSGTPSPLASPTDPVVEVNTKPVSTSVA